MIQNSSYASLINATLVYKNNTGSNNDIIAVSIWLVILLIIFGLQVVGRLRNFNTTMCKAKTSTQEPFYNETVNEGYDTARNSVSTDTFLMQSFSDWRTP